MKKIISAICASALILTLAACSKKDTLQFGGDTPQSAADTPVIPVDNPKDIELQKISDLRGDIDRQIENIKNSENTKIRFLDDFTVKLPETDVLHELELTHPKFAWRDYYDKFDRVFDRDFGDIYTEEDKPQLYYTVAIGDPFSEITGQKITLLNERRKQFESGELEVEWLFVRTNKAYLEMYPIGNGIFRLYRDGVITRAEPDQEPTEVLFSDAERHFKILKEGKDVNSDEKYALLDKEMSVKEAAEEVKRLVVEHEYTWGGALSPEIYEYRVFDLNDGKFGLEFMLAPSYKGVMFDMEDIFEGCHQRPADMERLNHDYSNSPAQAFIMESGQIETFLYGESAYDVTEIAEHNSVIPLEKAVEIAADKYGEGMSLWLGHAELLYSPMYQTAELYTKNSAFPMWKLMLSNSTDGFKYITYINAVTGEFEYYVMEGWVL